MGGPHYQWLLSHKLLSLMSDNLFSCLIGFSFLFFFFSFLCNIEQIPLVETKYLIPARYIPANTSLLIPDEKLESRTRRVLSNTYQKLIQSVFLDDSIPNGVKYLMWVWHQLPSDLTWMSFLRWWWMLFSNNEREFSIKDWAKGLPWWRSGWESACQCRGHGFEPWSGKIPHAGEQLGPWATITEPARLEPVPCNKRGRNSERPAQRDEEWPPLATTRESPRTETKTQHSHK